MPTMFRRFPCTKSIRQIVRHHSSNLNPKAVVIAAAVRTPNTFLFANEEHQMAGIVIDELVKRTSVPRDEFKKLFVCTSSDIVSNDSLTGVAKNLGLKSCQAHAIKDDACSVSGLQMCLESLQRHDKEWIILGDTRANIHQQQLSVLTSELLTTAMPFKKPAPAAAGHVQKSGSLQSPGAAALALTTAQTAERLQLQPLALVREFFIEQDNVQAMFRLNEQKPIQLNDVHSWQLVIPSEQQNHLAMLGELNDKAVQTYDVRQITASHLLTHTVHALPAGTIGCVVMESTDKRCLLLLLEKIIPKPMQPDSLPQLTLYTKNPCPLCDDLVAQLEENFTGEFELKKVFINDKENVRFLRLFRYDIPVLFLNGQFLCMHRLNEQVLRERLASLKTEAVNQKKP